MKLKDKLTKMLSGIEDLFMTNHSCLSCGRETPDGSKYSLCKNCLAKLRELKGKVCEVCGDKVTLASKICARCNKTRYNFDVNRSFAYYDGAAARIIKGLKYSGKKFYKDVIAEAMLTIDKYYDNVDVITFVPMSAKNKRARGYNQAEEIATALSEKLNKPVVKLLEKVGDGKHQAGLTAAERRENLIDTFKLADSRIELKGKVVLIVDDVFTTGATLNECAKMLKPLKPRKIKTVTFAKTELNFARDNINAQD